MDDALTGDDGDAVILCTRTQMHADQAIADMNAGKHVTPEMALYHDESFVPVVAIISLSDAVGLAKRQQL